MRFSGIGREWVSQGTPQVVVGQTGGHGGVIALGYVEVNPFWGLAEAGKS